MNRLPDNQAGEVVKKAIAYVGGWDTWAGKKNFSFYKNIVQLDSTGQEIRTIRQLHQYRLQPKFGARMTWEKEGKKYVIVNDGDRAWKYEDGKELTDEKSKKEAWNSSFGSNYVIEMPFKLTDPGAILTYDGIDTLEGNKVVHAVKVTYEKGARIHELRHSHAANKEKEVGRIKTVYANDEMQFNVPMAADLFEPLVQ